MARHSADVEQLGSRVAEAMGLLLQRRTRSHLYAQLVDPRTGVTATTYPIISGIARLGPVTATDLAAAVGLDRTVASRHASELEALGLLARRADPDDPRRSLLCLSPAGRRVVAGLRRRLATICADQLDAWPRQQAAAFVAGLERFVAELELAAT